MLFPKKQKQKQKKTYKILGVCYIFCSGGRGWREGAACFSINNVYVCVYVCVPLNEYSMFTSQHSSAQLSLTHLISSHYFLFVSFRFVLFGFVANFSFSVVRTLMCKFFFCFHKHLNERISCEKETQKKKEEAEKKKKMKYKSCHLYLFGIIASGKVSAAVKEAWKHCAQKKTHTQKCLN